MKKIITVKVPATSGNLGPGFDVLGLALNLYNEVHARVLSHKSGEPIIYIKGEGEFLLPRDRRNVIFKAVELVFKKAGKKTPQLEMACVNRIPLERGLGSSSSAILCGLLLGNELLNRRFSKNQLLNWATEMEGHPDDVAAALYGGLQASAVWKGEVMCTAWPTPKISVVVTIPHFKLSTRKARAVLPVKVPMEDAIANLASVALMREGFSKRKDILKWVFNDRLHEPYRAKLVPGFHQVKSAALKAGALGVILSGAGPTMLSFVQNGRSRSVGLAMQKAFQKAGVESEVRPLTINRRGAIVS